MSLKRFAVGFLVGAFTSLASGNLAEGVLVRANGLDVAKSSPIEHYVGNVIDTVSPSGAAPEKGSAAYWQRYAEIQGVSGFGAIVGAGLASGLLLGLTGRRKPQPA